MTELIQPTRARDPGPSTLQSPEPRPPDVPARPAVLRTPERPAASPETRREPVVQRPAPDVTYATQPRRESLTAAVPAAARNQDPVPAAPAGGARRPREVRGSEALETDPGGIIDWLLSEYPARKE